MRLKTGLRWVLEASQEVDGGERIPYRDFPLDSLHSFALTCEDLDYFGTDAEYFSLPSGLRVIPTSVEAVLGQFNQGLQRIQTSTVSAWRACQPFSTRMHISNLTGPDYRLFKLSRWKKSENDVEGTLRPPFDRRLLAATVDKPDGEIGTRQMEILRHFGPLEIKYELTGVSATSCLKSWSGVTLIFCH